MSIKYYIISVIFLKFKQQKFINCKEHAGVTNEKIVDQTLKRM